LTLEDLKWRDRKAPFDLHSVSLFQRSYSLPSPIADRRRQFEPYREHPPRSEGRDCEIESGSPVVGGHGHNREEISTKEHGTTDTQNIRGGQEENRCGTTSTLGKNQGSKEGVVG
jgi:hypothetical protein